MDIILVGIGGVFGGLTRFKLAKAITRKNTAVFPVGTFVINISGAFLLGALSGLNVAHSAYLLLGDGFLGAYTTFSTIMYEGFSLFKEREKLNAFVYILGTCLLGIAGFAMGFALSKLL